MAKAFVHTIKRDPLHVRPSPDGDTVMHHLSAWINHYNEVHHRTRQGTPNQASFPVAKITQRAA